MNVIDKTAFSASQDTLWGRLIAAGIRAPSGDNCQPWEFRLDADGRLLIDIVPEQAKSFFDFHHRATFLSVGAVIENIRIQAAGEGYACEVDHLGGERPGDAAAAVRLREDPAVSVSGARHQAMLERTVNRRPFFGVRPSPEKLRTLLADPIEGTQTTVYVRRRDITRWARLIYLAERIRYSHPVIHQELFAKIHLTREQINQERMGLEYDRLGIGPGAPALLRLLSSWERMQRLSRFGMDSGLANQSRLLGLSSGGIVLVSITSNSAADWMRSGEQTERLWVGAQELGLCTHPMTVALYLGQRYREEGMQNFLPKHQPMLEQIDEGLRSYLGDRVGAMLFRLGNAWKMRTPAVRLPVEHFIRPRQTQVVP